MTISVPADIDSIQKISTVPTILETVAATTGLGFVCIARVTNDSWTACAVLDKLDFGLKVGGELDITTTLCEEVRDTGKAIIIDCVRDDPVYCNHHTPRIYGFQSYISIPIFRASGEYFGTLCGLDPKPIQLSGQPIVSSMTLFAKLISLELENERQLADVTDSLNDARHTAELREQFIAVLGHDLRTPLGAIQAGVEVARRLCKDAAMVPIVESIARSAQRISALVDDVVDFTRGRMGGGISLNLRHEPRLHLMLGQVLEELRSLHPGRDIRARLLPNVNLLCDAERMGQMLSNLVKNALVHGDPDQPVEVVSDCTDGVFQLSVTNAGVRIPQTVVEQFFKPFWRGSQQGPHEGLGLGLFIVSEIARSHGGAVEVVTSDISTCFTYRVAGAQFIERRQSPRD